MTDCPRCGKNHYDMSRPIVPTCPFKPQRTGPGGLAAPDIVAMARLAQHDDRMATGALYGALADEIVRLRKAAVDRDIEKILAMTDEECRQAGVAEFGNEAAWRKAMGELKVKMLKAAGIPEQEGASEALPEPRSGDTSKPSPQEQGEEPTVDEIVAWFNAWLATPIDARDRVIIESMLRHVRNYPRQINEDAIRALRTPVEPVLPSEASTSSVCRIDLDKKGVDDVAIAPVEMFRLERMSATSFWVCAYLPGSDHPRHVFWLNSRATITATHTDETFRAKQGADVAAEGQDNPSSVCTSSPSPEQGIREALEYALKSMKAMRGVIDEAPAETWGVDGMGGEEAHLQTWWPKQEEYLHYADQDIAVVEAALSSVGRGGGDQLDPLRQAAAHLCAFDWERVTSHDSNDLNARILAVRAALSEGTHRT